MKPYQKLDGGVLHSVREYDIAEGTSIQAGQVVVLSAGLVEAAAAGVTGQILGVAAESHSGQADSLNPRANGGKISVYDDPGQVFRCAAPVIAATSGTAATVVAGGIGTFADDDFNGGYLMLLAKAEGSTNTDPVGTVKRISDFAATTKTFTVASGGTANAGDTYALFPPVGFAKGNLSADRSALVLTAVAALPLKVVGRLEGSREIMLTPGKHVFAVSV